MANPARIAALRRDALAFIRYIRWTRAQRALGVGFEAPGIGPLTDADFRRVLRERHLVPYRRAQAEYRAARLREAA